MLCELLDLHANRTGQNTARHAERIFSGAVRTGLGADPQADWVNGLALPKPSDLANAMAGGIAHVGAAATPSQARLQSPLLLQTRVGAVLTRGMLYFLRQVGANCLGRVQRWLASR